MNAVFYQTSPWTDLISASELSLKIKKNTYWNFAMVMYLDIYHTQNAFYLALKVLVDIFLVKT